MGDRTFSDSSPMANSPLSEHGLEVTGNVHWNLGWEELHEMAVSRKEAKYTSHGVLLATTGERTGRSPNDRFIVKEPGLADEVWWGQVNRPISPEKFER
ncbi:MAG: phosphoenolpyruvate carboxykinase (ATP), partial [Candidatus Thermoplasmatota archaeon]|nr:phosphoenolpyruvate carboxykinase (ATP) [Candidatus Thermoplasmatota archaeon]